MISDKKELRNDISAIEKRLRLLYEITSQHSPNLDEHITKALKLTTELLGLDMGIVSSIDDNMYIIMNHYSKNNQVENGQRFEIGKTICSITIGDDKVTAINNLDNSPYREHPCNASLNVKSYLGVPIRFDESVYGTLNFCSSKPNKKGFIEADKTLIKLLGEWVSGVIKRKHIEQKIVESERRFKLISTNSHDLICLHDPDGTYRFVSPSAKNITGYNPSELIGTIPYNYFHEEDLKRIQGSHQRALESNTIKSMQYRFRMKNGEYIWLDTATQPITNDEGEIVNLQTTSRDISEMKKMELIFSQAEKMANIGGWEYDLKTGKLTWSDEVYRIHEKPIGEEVFVEEGLSFYPGQAKQKIQDELENTLKTGETYDLEVPFISAKGNNKWVRAIGQAQLTDGKPSKLFGTFQDITKQKEYEERIRNQNNELKHLTSNRDKLYSIIGHDLKNALFGITGMADILKDEMESGKEDPEQLLYHANLLRSSSKNAHQLLKNLLKWINLQRQNSNPEFTEVDICDLILECISIYKVIAENKNISIETDLHDCPAYNGDPEMLKTCFRNLISNALKFSESDSKIKITSGSKDDQLIVKVKDFGIGMPVEVKENLFNPGDRPKRYGTNNEKGTGLGLLLCKEFVELHNGKIDVESEEGKGSEFIITLPKIIG